MRFEDTPELFGGGMGTGTYANIECEWCGKVYDGRETDRGDGDFEYSGDSISWTTFAGKQICDCCFEAIENEILHRMDDIIPWFTRILAHKKEQLAGYEGLLDRLNKELQKDVAQRGS